MRASVRLMLASVYQHKNASQAECERTVQGIVDMFIFFFCRRTFFILFSFRIFMLFVVAVAIVELKRGKSTSERMWSKGKKSKTLSLPFSVICARQFRLCCSISHTNWVFLCAAHFLIVIRFSWVLEQLWCVALHGGNIHWICAIANANEKKNKRRKKYAYEVFEWK